MVDDTAKSESKKKENVNALSSDWVKLEDGVRLLTGNVSVTHRKFKWYGHQASAVCLVGCAFHLLKKMNTWTKDTLDTILSCGDVLFSKSKQMEENRCREKFLPTHIHKYFYLKNLKVSMKVDVDIARMDLCKDKNVALNLEVQLSMFLISHSVAIFGFKERYFSIWAHHGYVFLFDPTSHDDQGNPWEGPPSLGYCCLYRFPTTKQLVETVLKFIKLKHTNRILLYPSRVEKVVKVNVTPPESLHEPRLKPPEAVKTPIRSKSHLVREISESKEVKEPVAEAEQLQPKPAPESPIPLERPHLRSVTNFDTLMDGKCGILRTFTSQDDPNFAKNPGIQGLANALASVAMLRVLKSKNWNRAALYFILKIGENLHHEIATLPPGEIPHNITIDDKKFTPKYKNHEGAIGYLVSSNDQILSLEQALSDYLLENDCTIITSDGDIAVWKEENRFYMFDPRACDHEGNLTSDPSGVACVMWFPSVKDLVAKYLSKIHPLLHKSRFVLNNITIEDLQEKAEDWCNFKALNLASWILRGTISQRDRRFLEESRNQQCTANAAMALALQELKPEHSWDYTTIDEILIRGDELHRACVDQLKENGTYRHPHLLVDELKRWFDVDLKRIRLDIEDCLINGVVNAKEGGEVLNLLRGLEEFFQSNDQGVVTANDQSMAVWKKEGVYFLFDSHSRDKEGTATVYGTACVLRLLSVEHLAKILLTNLGADKLNLYNISRVKVTAVDVTADGIVKPPLHHYKEISDYKAILRSDINQAHQKFDLNAGKQTVANCLMALGVNLLIPSMFWLQEDLNQMLVFGDKLYTSTMEVNYMEDLLEDKNTDDVTTNNIKKSWKIGPNLFQVDFEELAQGNLEENLKSLTGGEQEMFPAILESQYLTVALWKDDDLYYIFDPRSRDETGQVFGKDDWSAKIDPEQEVAEEATVEDQPDEDDEENERETTDVQYEDHEEDQNDEMNEEHAVDEEKSMDEEEKEIAPEKKGSAYWRLQEESGKACVLRFNRLDDLMDHILDNSPPNERQNVEFTWKVVKISTTPVLHESQKEALGDWHEFLEVDKCKWILRGTKTMADDLFPECNRSKQDVPMCIIAMAVASIYSMTKFKQVLLDYIMVYGDRFYTVARRRRSKILKDNKSLNLGDDDVLEIVNRAHFDIEDYPGRICLDDKMAIWSCELGVVTGDTTSSLDEVPNVSRGLDNFFKRFTYGMLECKDYRVAVWKNGEFFYMFDPHRCGPSGCSSPVGVSCITRFCNLEDLAEVFGSNLPKLGDHCFTIDGFHFDHTNCPRERQPEVEVKKRPKLGGFTPVMLGKEIIRGTVKMKCSNFSNGVNIHSAPVAFVALGVSLVHHPMTWTKLTIDAILYNSDDLYFETLHKLGDKFNPWTETLDIQRVNTDFNVGNLKANWAIRYKEQCGLVDVKNSKTSNLRQGLERFFEENSHGILLVHRLILAIWEQEDDGETIIYMYDPNSRGATGLPTHGGTACVVKFINAKTAFDHILACLLDEDKSRLQFVIVPVEIVVGEKRSKRKKSCKLEPVPKRKQTPSPKPYDGTFVTCHKKNLMMEELLSQRRPTEKEKRVVFGRLKIHQVNNREAIIRGLIPIPQKLTVAVNYVAFCMMQMSDELDKWSYVNISLILECGKLLYIDSYLAYKPPGDIVPLECILRKFRCLDHEVKLRLKRPLICGHFNKRNITRALDVAFMHVPCFLFNYDDLLVTVYFKSGFYYLFDPSNRDHEGNKTESEDGAAILMKFWDLEALVDNLVRNLGDIPDHEVRRFALLFLEFEYIKPVE